MWFVVAFLKKWDQKFWWFTNSRTWDATEGEWGEVTGTPYRTHEEAESVAVLVVGSVLDKGEVKVMTLEELDDYYYRGKLW